MNLVRMLCCAVLLLTLANCGRDAELSMLQMKRSIEDSLGITYDLRRDIQQDLKEVRTMPLRGDAFNRHLHTEYLRLTEQEIDQGEAADARRFLQRAIDAANGERVYPEEASTRHFEPAKAEQMRDARDRLIGLLYRQQGTTRRPDIAARAQAMFDCWQEAEADGGETNGTCQAEFEESLIALAARDDTPQVRELMVLLPAPDGSVGGIAIAGGGGTVELNEARQATRLTKTAGAVTAAPSAPFAMSQAEIDNEFAEVLAARPLQPISAVLRFESDSLNLTAGSQALLPRLLAEIARRPVPDVIIEGHADRAGSPGHNDKLSERRARVVREAVIKAGVPSELIQLFWYGESDPAVPTPDGVAEELNRRVEITVR